MGVQYSVTNNMKNTSKQTTWESGEVPDEKVWDQVQQAKELGFSVFTFEIVYPIAANNPRFIIIRARRGDL